MHRVALTRDLHTLAWAIALSLGFAAVFQPAPATFAAAPPTFSAPSYQFYGGVPGPSCVAVGDFNRDGLQDLAVANFYNNNVSILLGNGDGTFGAVLASYASGINPCTVAIGDFNRDGVPDLAVANRWTSDISIFIGKGDGTFFDAVNYGAGNQPDALAIGDFNEDGIQDLAVGNVEGANLVIFIGKGDGTFALTNTYLTGGRPAYVIVRDFNQDGHQDLAVANWGVVDPTDQTVSILLGNGDGTFAPAIKYPVGEESNPFAIAVGDFNEDGIEDLAVANYAADYVSILLGNGGGTFAAPVHFSLPGFTHVRIVVEDFNADGHQDLVVLNRDSNSWSLLVGNGDGTFAAPINYVEPDPHTDPRSVAVGDFNRDGKPDLVVMYYWDPSIAVFLNSTSSVAPVAAPPGLVSWWPMDSSTLDIADGNNASQENARRFVPGKVNSGITFDAGGYIEIPHAVNLALQQFTISAWARPDGSGPNNDTPGNVLVQKGILFSQGGGTAVSVGMWWSVIDGRFRFAIGEVGPEWIASSSIFPPGHFYHVAATYDGVTAKLYIDGVLEGQLALAKTMFYEPSVPWTIGSTAAHIRAVGYPRTWNGIIDEVEVYNRALAATDIQAIVDAGSAGHLAANAGPNQSVPEGTLVQLDGSRSRPLPGPDVRYDWIQVAGPVVTLNLTDPVHPTFTAPSVPPDGQTLTFQLAVTAFGVTSELSLPVNVRVVNVNHAPVAIASAPPVVGEGTLVQLDGSASFDPDGDSLSYAWTQISGPSVSLSDPTSVKSIFTAPLVTGPTFLGFQLVVSDPEVSSAPSAPVIIVVERVNHAPTADTTGSTQTVNEGATVRLNGVQSTDPDGDQLHYLWTQLAGPPVTLSDPTNATPTFTAPQVTGTTSLVFQLVVSDGQLTSAPAPATITVLDSNRPVACGAARPAVGTLWPPDHRMASIALLDVTDPDNDHVTITVTGVTQDEPVQGLGDGDSSPDAVRQGDTVLLRAERAGNGNGRVYRVSFMADDGHGSQCTGAVTVCVPHDRRSGICVVDGQQYDSTQP